MVRYAKPFKTRARTGYSRKSIAKRRPRTKSTQKIVSIVKNTLDRNLEQKMTVMPVLGTISQAISIPGMGLQASPWSTGGFYPGIYKANLFTAMAMGQGPHQDQRIGNCVKTKALTFRGVVGALPTSGTNTGLLPFEVHLLWYKRKKYDVAAVHAPADLKHYATNSLLGVGPSLMNSVIPWNKDAYVIKAHKVFRLRPLASTFAAAATVQYNNQNSNAPQFHRFHVTIPIKENLIFEDNATIPQNDWLSFAAYVINSDGTVAFDTSTPPQWQERAYISMDMVYRYTDA